MACNQNYVRLGCLYANSQVNEMIIKELVKHGNINYQLPPKPIFKSKPGNLSGCTALHIAVKNEDLNSIEMLLKNGADITIKDNQGMTALHRAIEHERSSINSYLHKMRGPLKDSVVNALLSAHVDYNIIENPRSKSGLSHLHAACMMNNVEAIEHFLKNGASANESVDANSSILPGYTPLHFTSRYCSAEAAQILLDHGAQPHTKDAQGFTPLHMLIQRNMEIADWMNMGKRARCGFIHVEYKSNERMIKAMLEKCAEERVNGTGLSRLHIACTLKDTSMIERLLEETTDLNQSVRRTSRLWPGYTALHFAAHFNVETVKLLMNRGAKRLIRALNEFTPLDLCLQRYKAEVVHDIIASQPDWRSIQFSDARTKLLDFIYCMRNKKEFDNFLEGSERDVNMFISHHSPILPGYTPLHFVTAAPGRTNVIDDILKDTLYATKIDETDLYNCTEEEERLYVERIDSCLNREADLTIQDYYKSTPIHLAFKLQREHITKLMVEKYSELESGAMVDRVDEHALSHYQIGCVTGVTKLISALCCHVNDTDFENYALISDYKYSCNGRQVVFSAGSTPLHTAVIMQNLNILQFFFKQHVDIYAQDANGMTALHRALPVKTKASLDICNALLWWRCGYLEDRVANCGLTHLHVACAAKRTEAIELLLHSGSDINATISMDYDDDMTLRGLTPLQIAIKERSRSSLRILIRAGAKIFVKPLHYLDELYENYPDLFFEALERHVADEKLVDEDKCFTELHVACFAIDVDSVKKLLENGANPNARVHSRNQFWPNYTPLHLLAIEYKRRKFMANAANTIVKMMIDHGADVTLTTDDNETPLHKAFNQIFHANNDDLNNERFFVSRTYKCPKAGMPLPKRLDTLLKMPPASLETQLLHGWNDNDRSLNIHLKPEDPLTLYRKCIRTKSTDCIRGKVGYTKGLHIWEITWSKEQRGTHSVIGVATAKAPLHTTGRKNLIGSCESSCGWNIEDKVLIHNAGEIYYHDMYPGYLKSSYMQGNSKWKFKVPDKILVILDMDEGTLGYMVNDKYLGAAFEGLKGKTLYPIVSVNKRHAEVTMKYIGGIEDDEQCEADSLSIFIDVLLSGHRDFKMNPTDHKGISAFHIACFSNNVPVVKEFLENEVNVNRPIDHFFNAYAGYTPLHLAAYYKFTEIVDLLIEYGADINARDREGNTPLHCAADCSHYIQHKSDVEASENVLVSLFRAGADVKAKNKSNQTPIELIMETNGWTSKITEMFLENQSHVNLFDNSNAGYIAMAISCESTIDNILKHPFYVAVINNPEGNGPDNMRRTPIHNIVALRCPNKKSSLTVEMYREAIEGLAKVNFDIDQCDFEGRTPLHYAVKFGNVVAIRALLDLGADLNVIDIDGETPYSLGRKLNEERTPNEDSKYPQICEIFINHVYKMKLARVEVSEVNVEVYRNQFDADKMLDIEKDLKQLEDTVVGTCTFSLREFLYKEIASTPYQNMDQEARQSFDDFFQPGSKRLLTDYPEFAGVLQMQYRKVRAQTSLLKNTSFFSFLYSYLPWA